jgi:D-alanine-D-alanine ligase
VLPITEIVSENDFFDYEAKYQGKIVRDNPTVSDEMTKSVSHKRFTRF